MIFSELFLFAFRRRKSPPLFLPIFLFLLFFSFPLQSHAIANPFVAFSIGSIIFYFFLALFIFLPSWLHKTKFFLISISPFVKHIFFISLVSLFLVPLIIIPHRFENSSPSVHHLGYAKNCSTLGDLSKDLRLHPDDMLVDIRPPNHFDMYHIKGACNLDPVSIIKNRSFQRELEAESRNIFLVSETAMTGVDYYNLLLKKRFPTNKWKLLESGVLFFRLSHKFGLSPHIIDYHLNSREARESHTDNLPDVKLPFFNPILEFNDKQVIPDESLTFYQDFLLIGGPHYSRGWHTSILANHPSWKQRPVSFLFRESRSDVIRLYVEDFSYHIQEPQSYFLPEQPAIQIARSHISIKQIEDFHGKDLEKVVFICDNAMTCFASEALASELLAKNREVYGYVMVDQSYPFLDKYQLDTLFRPQNFPGLELVLFFLSLLVSMVLFYFILFLVQRVQNYHSKKIHYSILEGLLLSVLPFAGFQLAYWTQQLSYHTPEFYFEFLTTYILDSSRIGWPIFHFLIPIIFIVVSMIIYLHRPNSRSPFTILFFWIFVLLFLFRLIVVKMPYLTFFSGILAVFSLGLPLIIHACSPYIRLFRINSKISSFPVVLPLKLAHHVSFSGQKSQMLARCIQYNLLVPNGYIFLTTIQSFTKILDEEKQIKSLHRALRSIRMTMKSGHIIVRSSAPDEDKKGRSQAGVYTSALNVKHAEIIDSIRKVLESYHNQGISESEPVAVLIQSQVNGDYSGVCLREDHSEGSGLLIEANTRSNVSITAGKGAQLWFRIGQFSQKIISGNSPPKKLRITSINHTHLVLEKIFKKPLNTEWSLVGKQFYLHQVRPLPKLQKATLENQSIKTFDLLEKDIRRLPNKPNHTILDNSELPDYQYGASVATKELLSEMYEYGLKSKGIGGWVYSLMARLGPEPILVEFENGLFLNKVPRHPFACFVLTPLLTMKNMELRIFYSLLIRRLQTHLLGWKRLVEPYALEKLLEDQSPSEIAQSISELRQLLFEGAVRNLFDALVLVNLLRKNKKELNRDKFLLHLAHPDKSDEEIRRFSYRSSREYSLDTPRYGESTEFGKVSFEPFFEEKETVAEDGRDEFAQNHLSSTRDSLSFGVALLRAFYLKLAKKIDAQDDQIFDYSFDELKTLIQGEVKPAKKTEIRQQKLPVKFTLKALERWASGEREHQESAHDSYWVSGQRQLFGKVVDRTKKTSNGTDNIWVVEHPTVDDASAIPSDQILIAFGGNRLCHAAIILRERGISSIFQAESYRNILTEGQVVQITEDGGIESVEKNQNIEK